MKSGTPSSGADHTRDRADTFVEGAGGGGNRMAQAQDPLKDIPDRQKAYWKSKGYTKAQMIEEAKFGGVNSLKAFRRVAGSKTK